MSFLTYRISFRDRSTRVIAVPLLFGVAGAFLGGMIHFSSTVTEREYPLPHHIPKYHGNLTLRFAMVHDVIHDRFPRHGPAYYRARNQSVQESLKKLKATTKGEEADQYFRLLDDLGVGLEFLGQHREAVDLMRDKLKRQEALGYQGKELYSTYANLGTFLILWQLSEGVGDVPMAKKRIQESVEWIHKAIDVFPESHFGREQWQVVLEEFLLAVLDHPSLLLSYDMVGNRLDKVFYGNRLSCFDEAAWLRLWRSRRRGSPSQGQLLMSQLKNGSEMPWNERAWALRRYIVTVGAEEYWNDALKPSHKKPVPFDEPTLGIVGMWRMGAGANPHFALALGEIMLRVGQRHIAWTAFERAGRLKEHFWPDPAIQEQFAKHCRARQEWIQKELPQENWDGRLGTFMADLRAGTNYQKAYQDYEAKQIAAGIPVDDPHFYDAFDATHGSIATPVGDEDKVFEKETRHENGPWGALLAGAMAFSAAAGQMMIARRAGRQQETADLEE